MLNKISSMLVIVADSLGTKKISGETSQRSELDEKIDPKTVLKMRVAIAKFMGSLEHSTEVQAVHATEKKFDKAFSDWQATGDLGEVLELYSTFKKQSEELCKHIRNTYQWQLALSL